MQRATLERSIHRREGVGACAHVVQGRKLFTGQLSFDQPTLIVVRRGSKCLRASGQEVTLAAGELIAVNAGQCFDVINAPCEHADIYEADSLAFGEALFEHSLYSCATGKRIHETLVCRSPSPQVFAAFSHACEAIRLAVDIPQRVAMARMNEMLAWLDHVGGCFDTVSALRVAVRVRRLVKVNLAAAWTAPRVASQLGMSEATLRRRLAEEDSQFQQLLAETRMAHALTLLQVTNLPVTSIAYDVGYQNPSQFSARFRRRFGFNPSDVRHRKTGSTPEDRSHDAEKIFSGLGAR
jgi:AraC-like DNA-binding protein